MNLYVYECNENNDVKRKYNIVQVEGQKKILSLCNHYENLLSGRIRKGRKLKNNNTDQAVLKVERKVSLEL
mgnify:CR=1 FL=1